MVAEPSVQGGSHSDGKVAELPGHGEPHGVWGDEGVPCGRGGLAPPPCKGGPFKSRLPRPWQGVAGVTRGGRGTQRSRHGGAGILGHPWREWGTRHPPGDTATPAGEGLRGLQALLTGIERVLPALFRESLGLCPVFWGAAEGLWGSLWSFGGLQGMFEGFVGSLLVLGVGTVGIPLNF